MNHRTTDEQKIGCPTWIRTMTRRVKVACATITPSGSEVRREHGAARTAPVKVGKARPLLGLTMGHIRGQARESSARLRL